MKKKSVPGAKPGPVPPSAPVPPPALPHPLALNPNEGRWFHLCHGPHDGWFNCHLHGNPPFDVPVQIALFDTATETIVCSATGVRRQRICPAFKKEVWEVACQFSFPDARHQIAFWRPLALPPA